MGIAWSKSGALEWYQGEPAAGALAYFYQGGTTTPLVVYEEADESTPHEDPVEADGNGRWPAVFIPFVTSYDVKVTTEAGTQLYYHVEIPNPDPVEASEDSVDASELIQTGDIIFSPKTGTRSGFVRCNGRTIGSASSGASERANDDTSDLYSFLWDNFANGILAVTGGRGANAAADFAANKPIAVFDGRSGVLRGVSDMGNSSDGLLASATFTTGDATTGGSWAGANTHALTEAQLAAHTHSISITSSSDGAHTHTGTVDSSGAHTHTVDIASGQGSHTHNYNAASITGGGNQLSPFDATVNLTQTSTATVSATLPAMTGTAASNGAHTHTFTTASNGAHTHSISGTSGSTGSGTAHNNVSKSILGTFFMKL